MFEVKMTGTSYSSLCMLIAIGLFICGSFPNNMAKAVKVDAFTISVGTLPTGIIYNQVNKNVYVSNSHSNTVSVIDSHTNRIIATILVGVNPTGMTYSSDTGNVYVSNMVSNTVSVIDGTTNRITNTIPVGVFPFAAAYDPNNHYVYVCNYKSNDPTIIDTLPRNITTNNVINTIKTGGMHPIAITSAPDVQGVYVANQGSDSISVINDGSNEVVGIIKVGLHPSGIAYAPNSGKVYVTNKDSNRVDVNCSKQSG